jgi:cell wall-associated NlpC family hydrolase
VIHGRKRLVSVLSGLALAAGVGLVPGSASAEPDVKDVQARVDQLWHQAEVAQERYHDARLELTELRSDLKSLKADQARQDQRLEAVRTRVKDAVISQYQGENLSAVGQVFVSKDPGAFMSELATMSSYNDLQSQLFTDYSNQVKALQIRSSATQRRLADISSTEKQLARDKAAVDSKLAEAKDLLGHLKAQQRAAMTSRSEVRPPTTSVAVSGRASAAVSYALAQVGKPYVYGASGPSAFDCSGLTMAAWAQAGVYLPHSSSAQYSSGPHIAASALQPGDLVFYYSPISHVGMYIGNGMIVNAENPSAGVRVTGLYSMPYVGAVRPG